MNDLGALTSTTIGFIIVVLVIVWAILWLLVPFMIHSLMESNKRVVGELKHLNGAISGLRKDLTH